MMKNDEVYEEHMKIGPDNLCLFKLWWEFMKENKKVRKKEMKHALDQESNQENNQEEIHFLFS